VAYLKEENRILRARLPRQINTALRERLRLVKAGRRLGLQLKPLISIVSYQTFRRWVREMEQTRTRQPRVPRRKPGRPRTPEDVREIVVRTRTESGLGYTRILVSFGNWGFTSRGRPFATSWLSTVSSRNPLRLDPIPGTPSWPATRPRCAEAMTSDARELLRRLRQSFNQRSTSHSACPSRRRGVQRTGPVH
jgi:putative transposase